MSNPWTKEEFYRQRDRRSVSTLGSPLRADHPVHVHADAAACSSKAGQVLLLALANQLARVHRRVSFFLAASHAPVAAPTLFGGQSIARAVLKAMEAIDPFGSFSELIAAPPGATTIGIGELVPTDLDWYVGARGAIGILDRAPSAVDISLPGTVRGAGLASCLGAAALFRTVHGLPSAARRLSAWNFAEGEAADIGPHGVPTVDVGRTLMIGAGAVASCLAYWSYSFGLGGSWTVIDADLVKIHNTNRSLVFTPADAGWGGTVPRRKVHALAPLLSAARSEVAWYHDSVMAKEQFDVLLALANEHDVRAQVASLSAPLVLHATTSENWISQLHRHIAGRDDCIGCRMLDVKVPSLSCSSGLLTPSDTEEAGDAALPFLSAASGLMLAAAMERLAAGALEVGPENDWRWYWDSAHLTARDGIRHCRTPCPWSQPQANRRRMHAGSRWIALDQ